MEGRKDDPDEEDPKSPLAKLESEVKDGHNDIPDAGKREIIAEHLAIEPLATTATTVEQVDNEASEASPVTDESDVLEDRAE